MRADAEVLLDRLLARYQAGGVTQEQAAKLVGIRRADFVELSAMRRWVHVLEAIVWQRYMAAFLYRFPECDKRATHRPTPQWRESEGRRYTDEELLTPPQRITLAEAIGTDGRTPLDKMDVGLSPPAKPRALPRDTGQQLAFDWAA